MARNRHEAFEMRKNEKTVELSCMSNVMKLNILKKFKVKFEKIFNSLFDIKNINLHKIAQH